jgi:Squalene-hopene cyclase C-terminal domain/Prenyltransferase and squalene oxidase repeat
MRAFIATLSVAFVLAALSASAAGDAPNPKHNALLDSTVRFLQDSQQPSGGFAQAGEPSQGTSAWVALALAAAGINPRNQAMPCGTDAYTYLVTHFREATGGEIAASEGQIVTTDFERELLVVNATGADPHDFAGFDLVEEILDWQLPGGSFPYLPGGEGQINTTIFAILALSPIGEPAAQAAIREAAEWLIARQNDNGGWYWTGKGAVSEVDMTGAAIEALNAAGPPGASAERAAFESAQREGFEYLEDAQLPDGGFPALPASEGESNVASTAWAVQGIWSAGGNPETWRTGSGLASEEPLDYMESMQQPDGHIRFSQSSDVNGIWMTAYVVPAFAGQALPIPEAAFSNASMPPCETNSSGAETGVIASGGGKGAPPFSRPKPQSKGKTPGGARIVRNKGLRPRNQSKSRRGANAKQPTGTEAAEPNGANAGEESEVTAVSPASGPGAGNGAQGHSANDRGNNDAEAQSSSGAEGGSPPLSAALREAAQNGAGGSGGRQVSGVVIGDANSSPGGELAFGAPGLRSARADADQERWVAAGIGAAALLLALGGAQWERRRQEVLP